MGGTLKEKACKNCGHKLEYNSHAGVWVHAGNTGVLFTDYCFECPKENKPQCSNPELAALKRDGASAPAENETRRMIAWRKEAKRN